MSDDWATIGARALVAKWERGDDEAHRQWLRDVAVPDLAGALRGARIKIEWFHKEQARLSGCLIAINEADPAVPASVLRGIAYDSALNCITPDVARYQIERRHEPVTIAGLEALLAEDGPPVEILRDGSIRTVDPKAPAGAPTSQGR